MNRSILVLLMALGVSALSASADNQPPLIDHAGVTLAVHGQNLVLRAHVTDDSAVRSVTLHYTGSRDAAPFRLPMQDAGTGVYTVSLRPELFAGLTRLFYYIEAKDDEEAISETPWYTIELRAPRVEGTAAPEPEVPAVRPYRSRWLWPSVAAGGVVLGGTGIALALRDRDDNGGSPGNPPATNGVSYAGTYVGNATTCVQPPNEGLRCAQSPVTLVIRADGMVSSDDLVAGEHLEAPLSGTSFVLTRTIAETNRIGHVFYTGTLVGNRILGTIQGSVTVETGTETYSGNFAAVRQ